MEQYPRRLTRRHAFTVCKELEKAIPGATRNLPDEKAIQESIAFPFWITNCENGANAVPGSELSCELQSVVTDTVDLRRDSGDDLKKSHVLSKQSQLLVNWMEWEMCEYPLAYSCLNSLSSSPRSFFHRRARKKVIAGQVADR